jgi:hypothetical protein
LGCEIDSTVNLLAGLVHPRIFEFDIDGEWPLRGQFIKKVSDRVPRLEYFSMPHLNRRYKRVGGQLVICDSTECPCQTGSIVRTISQTKHVVTPQVEHRVYC